MLQYQYKKTHIQHKIARVLGFVLPLFISVAMQLSYDVIVDSKLRELYGGQCLVGILVQVAPPY